MRTQNNNQMYTYLPLNCQKTIIQGAPTKHILIFELILITKRTIIIKCDNW